MELYPGITGPLLTESEAKAGILTSYGVERPVVMMNEFLMGVPLVTVS